VSGDGCKAARFVWEAKGMSGGHLGTVTVTPVTVPSGAWTLALARNPCRREVRILNNESGSAIYFQFASAVPTGTTRATAMDAGEIESWQDEDIPIQALYLYQLSGAPIVVKVEEGI